MKVALTKDYIKDAKFETNTEVFDENLPGFGIRIAPKRRTFFCVYWKRGRKVRANLGRFPAVSLADAKSEAKRISGNGLDPAGERRLQKEAGNFERVAKLFIEAAVRGPRRKPTNLSSGRERRERTGDSSRP